jgi:hypothetical protein
MSGKSKEILPARKVPDIQHTIPEVFILESLDEDDEDSKRFEGRALADMLRLAGKNPKYHYFQRENELPHLVGLFRESKCRFLHISSHATDHSIGLTHGEISYDKFAKIFAGHLKLRRLFFSACQIGNQQFVDAVAATNNGMHSIVAPAESIDFDHAAALWSAFYVSIFAESSGSMKSADIAKRLKALSYLFPVDFFLATYNPKKNKWRSKTVKKA